MATVMDKESKVAGTSDWLHGSRSLVLTYVLIAINVFALIALVMTSLTWLTYIAASAGLIACAGIGIVFTDSFKKHQALEATINERDVTIENQKQEVRISREEAEANLRAAERALQEQKSNQAKLSHETKTPIANGLRAFESLQMLLEKDGYKNETVTRVLEIGIDNMSRSTTIVNGYLGLIEGDHDAFQIVERTFYISHLIDAVCKETNSLARESNVQVKYKEADLEILSSCKVVTDEERVRQILCNLISNAIKYNRKDGTGYVEISYRTKVMASALDGKTHNLIIEVADNGIGIADDQKDRIFRPFKQEQRGPIETRDVDGYGLGLPIVKDYLVWLQGDIQVKSQKGVGSVFEVIIPISLTEPVTDENERELEKMRATPAHILLLEDNRDTAMLTKTLLEAMRHKVDVAYNHQEALELTSAHEYDAIFVDIFLPKHRGTETAKAIREGVSRNKDKPIIGMTAGNVHQLAKEDENVKYLTQFLTKGLPSNVYLETVHQCRGVQHKPMDISKLTEEQESKVISINEKK